MKPAPDYKIHKTIIFIAKVIQVYNKHMYKLHFLLSNIFMWSGEQSMLLTH